MNGETRTWEERVLREALRRGWVSAEALVRWVAERADGTGALLDAAVSRGVLDGERARRLRLESDETSPRSLEPVLPAGPAGPAGPALSGADAPTRRARPESVDGRLPADARLREAPTRVTPHAVTADPPRVAVLPALFPHGSEGDDAGAALPPPTSLVTLPGEMPFEPAGVVAGDRYELGQVVGRGGMGVVYVARDRELGRKVALKTLRSPGRANPGHVRALVREAQTTGQLDHPGIVPVYELRRQGDGSVFYTMKLVTGVSLAEVIRRLRRGQADAVRDYRLIRRLQVFQQICMALHYAHTRGVIHRDLKPANVLLGGYGEVLVVDWGIALAGVETGLREGNGIGEGVVARGQLVGTPRYMSPEQASGNMAALDARSDIYALGVILHELVTLALPFEALDTLAWLARVRLEPLPPPTHDARGRAVPTDLVPIIQRATAVDRRDRYPDARALWEDVQAWLEGRQERDRRRHEAAASWLRGRRAADRYRELSERRAALEEQIRALEAALDAWSPRDRKEALQRLVVQRENLDLLLARAFSDATRELQRCVTDDPGAEPPRRVLARLLRDRFRAAAARGDVVAMTWFGELVEQVERAPAEAGAEGPDGAPEAEHRTAAPPAAGDDDAGLGRLRVRSFPEGAEVSVLGVRDVEADPEWPPERVLGRAPLADVRLQPGIHFVSARMDGYRDARYPVFVSAGSHQDVLLTLTPWAAANPMVGRDTELTHLRTLFESVVERRHACAALLVGEPGAGRTRLQDAFGDYVEGLPYVVIFTWVHCLSIHQGVPFHALVEVLRFRSGVRRNDPPDVALERLQHMARAAWVPDDTQAGAARDAALGAADEAAAALSSLPGFDAPPPAGLSAVLVRARAEGALREYLVRLARRYPIAMIFKEMQWIDGASRRFLEGLLRRHGAALPAPAGAASEAPSATATDGGLPLFVLGSTAASVEENRQQGNRLLSEHPRVLLPPLPRAAAAQLVATLLKGRAGEEVVTLVNDRARGNPYLVEELTGHLRAAGWIENVAGEWRLARSASGRRAAELPHVDVSSFIARRARSLPDAERAALQAAAVVGRVFWAEALSALGVPRAAAVLRELARRDLVQVLPHARYDGTTEYTFRLETLWRVAYADVPAPERRGLHQRTAAWLESLPPVVGGRSFEHRALLATHHDRAGAPAAAARLRAGLARDAAALEAFDEAVYHWDRALACPLPPAERAAWRAERAAALARR
jgi:hypothetical protein